MAIKKNTPNILSHLGLSFTTIINQTMDLIPDMGALGIYCYLASKPEGWIIREQDLMNRFNCGRDSIRAKYKILRSLNLVKKEAIKDQQGKIVQWTTTLINHITETPSSGENHITEKPHAGSTSVWEIHPLSNKGSSLEIKERPIENKNQPSAIFCTELSADVETLPVVDSYQYPDTLYGQQEENKLPDVLQSNPFHIPDDLLRDWMTIRKQKRQAITVTAWNMLNQELAKCHETGISVVGSFEEMVNRGWSTLKIGWLQQKKSHFDNQSTDWAKGIEKDMF